MTAYAVTDSATMLRRNLRHALRYPSMTIATIGGPVLILLLFNYAFGDALAAGIGGGEYIDYIAPGILLMAATSGSTATAVAVCSDMTEGIINRFRTMAISRTPVLTGHVVGSMIQTMASIAVVIAIALAIGFRPTAGPVEWVEALGLLALVTFALTWLSTAFGARHEERRDGEQRAAAAAVPAVPRLGDRADRLDACGDARIRRERAVHADHRDAPRPAHGHPHRQQRDARRRLVRRARAGRLPLGAGGVQPRVVAPAISFHRPVTDPAAARSCWCTTDHAIQRDAGSHERKGGR
jgi:hypothetical protein